MIHYQPLEAWFVTGSQHLYGPETLRRVAADAEAVVRALNDSKRLPIRIVFKPVLTTPDAITELCAEANAARQCVGIEVPKDRHRPISKS